MKLGTRGSNLALAQATKVKNALESLGHDVEVVEVETLGDRRDEWKSLQELEGDGVFTRELDAALLEEAVDVAVHSMKDVPTDLPRGVVTGAVPERGSVHDVLIGKELDDLGDGDRVGTGSPRRQAQMRRAAPGVEMVGIRGNVETRIDKVGDEVDTVVLAEAGINRLGLRDVVADRLPLDGFLPAPGQGAIAVSAREDSREETLLTELDHGETRRATEAERALLNELGTGCVEPIGAHGTLRDGDLRLVAVDYEKGLSVETTGAPEDADRLGREAAREIQ